METPKQKNNKTDKNNMSPSEGEGTITKPVFVFNKKEGLFEKFVNPFLNSLKKVQYFVLKNKIALV